MLAFMAVTFLYPQEESTDEILTVEDFMELEVTRDLQKALMARFTQKMNLIRLRNQLAGVSEKREDVLANIERNELLLEEVERYFYILNKAFRKESE